MTMTNLHARLMNCVERMRSPSPLSEEERLMVIDMLYTLHRERHQQAATPARQQPALATGPAVDNPELHYG